MVLGMVFDSTSEVMEKSLEVRMRRQGFLASNIANAETANYRALDIDFSSTMENIFQEQIQVQNSQPMLAMATSEGRHMTNERSEFSFIEPDNRMVFASGDSHSVGNDNNSVSLELQLMRMQQNTLQHAAVARLLGNRLAGLQNIMDSTA